MPSKQNVLALVSVMTGSLVWGLMWYPYRMLEHAGISGTLATLSTYLFAMFFGAFMLPRVSREMRRHVRSDAIWWVVWLILASGWSNLGYVLAILHGEVMRVVLLFYLAPLWTILFSYWLLDERLSRNGYLVIMLSLAGAVVMLWKPKLGMPQLDSHAEWIGLSAGMSFALANVVSRRSAHLTIESKSYSVLIGTTLLTAPFVWWQGDPTSQLAAANVQTWLVLAFLGAVLFAASYVVQFALAHLPANRAIILFMFELIVAAVSSYVLAGEVMQWRDWLGASLIVSASLLSGKLYAEEG